MSAVVVNMFAGPGAGKSTMAAAVFTELKYKQVDCEYAQEFAKDLTWEERFKTLDDQIYIFGKQHHRLYRLQNKVSVIVNDSPLLFSIIYNKLYLPKFEAFVAESFESFDNLNYYIERNPATYNPNGRTQDLAGAITVDNKIKETLAGLKVPHKVIAASKDSVATVVEDILAILRGELKCQ